MSSGVSLGGMIGQAVAVHHAQQVRTLTSISSAPGWGYGSAGRGGAGWNGPLRRRRGSGCGAPELARVDTSDPFERCAESERVGVTHGTSDVRDYAAYKAALDCKGKPTVILAKTIKGYGLGEGGEGRNVTHNQKKLNEEELREFRTRFGIPISDERVAEAPFYRPPEDSPEMKYLRERRKALGGPVPSRSIKPVTMEVPRLADYDKTMAKLVSKGPGKDMSTTMGYVRLLGDLLRDKKIGKNIVPIVPDESRTFGMEGLFRQVGIYSHVGQLYEPVDSDQTRVLQGSEGRPALRGRHHRSRFDVVVHRRRHGLLVARREHDPHVHLLLDVRLPADRRPDLGRRRCPREGFYSRRHVRPHDAQRRRPAAPGRPQPAQRDRVPDGARVRPGLRLRNRRDHLRRPQAAVRRQRNGDVLHHAAKRKLRDARDAGRLRGRHHPRHVQGFVGRRRGPAPRPALRQRRDPAASAARLRRFWPRSTTFRATCGASPATTSSAATRRNASAGTCCIRRSRRACRTSSGA